MQATNVFVLHDRQGTVYGVVTDEDIADSWLTYDADFGVTQCEVDDYTAVNLIADLAEEEEEGE